MSTTHDDHTPNPEFIPIQIDRQPFKVPSAQNPVTGEFLRALSSVGPDYDLWLRLPGDDKKIEPQESVTLTQGMHFYSAKSVLTPG